MPHTLTRRQSAHHIAGSTYIEFDEVEVPVANLLGKENEGFEIIMSSKPLTMGAYTRPSFLV